jgi:hypothetical protein
VAPRVGEKPVRVTFRRFALRRSEVTPRELAVSPVEVALAIDAVETANTIAIASTNNASLKNVFDRRDEMTLEGRAAV